VAWFEDEQFWSLFAPLMFDEAHWAEVPAVVDGILRLAGLPSRGPGAGAALPGEAPLRVLDTCCGVGRHSLEFAGRGFAVTGIDITEPYLEAARDSASGGSSGAVEFLKADLRSFRRPAGFDLAVNLFRSFGYFDTPEEDFLALQNIAASLAPGGALVLDCLGKEVAVHEFIEGEWFERGGCTILTEFKVAGDWEGLVHRWILLKDGERYDYSFTMRLYSATEMRSLLLRAGFDSVEIHGNIEGAPYDEKATSLVAVARIGEARIRQPG
jgi:SAM-dependent methyltransferase